jgi:butyryl-CoA dehydrogenase
MTSDYYSFSPEQIKMQQMIREIADTHIRPLAAKIDEDDEYPLESFRRLSEAKVGGIMVPKVFGGLEEGLLTTCIVQEELGRASASVSLMMSVPVLCSFALMNFGSQAQKEALLPSLVDGSRIFNFSLTEPGGGSDVAGMKTMAVRDGDDYVLTGRKSYVCNAGVADYYNVYAMTDPEAGVRGISLFLIDKDTPGLSFPRKENKLGMRGHIHGDVVLKDCRVSGKSLVGKPGQGFLIAMKTMDPSRVLMSGNAIGVAREAYDAAMSYAQRRVAFGKPIAQHQTIAFTLADMAMEIHLARLIAYHAAGLMDQGADRIAKEAAMTKLYASEAVMRVADKAMKIFASEGYSKGTDAGIERLFRDARSFEIMEGTSEIQRLVISRELMR